ncbi:MAG TPA: GNAT family N-acetyltransferase [Gaiella sp.]|nr:GNAT family N-acetyltransferase [Gaiella sp.]
MLRLAFGTMAGLPDPLRWAEGADLARCRFGVDPEGAFKAVAGGQLVGSAFVVRWGGFAVFGPLSVRPDFWDRGVGSLLWEACEAVVEHWGVGHVGLFTHPESTKHVHLYRKHGFWPRFLVALTEKQVAHGTGHAETFTSLDAAAGEQVLRECAALTGTIHPGLDVSREIASVTRQEIGDVVLVSDARGLAGFAVCHAGAGSETRAGTCYVKFAAARPGDAAAGRLRGLLDACERFAAARDLTRMEVGVNLAREGAACVLEERGYRTYRYGLAMNRPNVEDVDRPDAFVLDDRR